MSVCHATQLFKAFDSTAAPRLCGGPLGLLLRAFRDVTPGKNINEIFACGIPETVNKIRPSQRTESLGGHLLPLWKSDAG
jgi:hypothetical protein